MYHRLGISTSCRKAVAMATVKCENFGSCYGNGERQVECFVCLLDLFGFRRHFDLFTKRLTAYVLRSEFFISLHDCILSGLDFRRCELAHYSTAYNKTQILF
jgi:hypothetical protein